MRTVSIDYTEPVPGSCEKNTPRAFRARGQHSGAGQLENGAENRAIYNREALFPFPGSHAALANPANCDPSSNEVSTEVSTKPIAKRTI
jgi:hypothetical protein